MKYVTEFSKLEPQPGAEFGNAADTAGDTRLQRWGIKKDIAGSTNQNPKWNWTAWDQFLVTQDLRKLSKQDNTGCFVG